MQNAQVPRIFLSYARSDRDYAVDMRDELKAAGLTVWLDLQDLEAGQWWSQIADALDGRSIEHIVLIASPDAQVSRIVAQECWLAQREGKTASLVVPPRHAGKIDFNKLPRFMQAAHHYPLTETGQKAKFIERLREPGQGPRRPRPEGRPRPADYVAREKEYAQMRAALLDAEVEATTATVVLSGHGGFGKTTLATAFINDEAVQQAYFNGILLVELGEGLVKLPKTYEGRKSLEGLIKAKIETLIKTLEGRDERFDELDAAKAHLKEVLDKRHGAVLLWIDDAWDEGHAKHFIDAAPNAAKLVTTRNRDMIPEAATRVDVDELTDAEAGAFMGWLLHPADDIERTGLRELATTTAGRWPILIRQINAQLRYQTAAQSGRKAQVLGDAITSLRTRLRREGVDDLDKSTDTNRATAVRLSVGVSFDMLREEDRHRKYTEGFHEARYIDLAGFQEAEVPIATIARLWGHLGVLRRAEAPKLDARNETKRAEQEGRWRAKLHEESIAILERLYALALLQKLDAADADGMVRLHDVMRQYLAEKLKAAKQAFHQQFVLAYDAESGEMVSDMTERERRYFYTWYPTHLHEAGESEALEGLLLNPGWMLRKLNALEEPLPLLADYERLGRRVFHSLIERTLRLIMGIISRDPRQLLPQLEGRLMSCGDPATLQFINESRRYLPRPAILTLRPSLTPPGPEISRLEGHRRSISALAMLPNGRLVSSSWDHTFRLWDVETGGEIVQFPVPVKDEVITALCLLPDGQLASGSFRNIRLWDVTSNEENVEVKGFADSCVALAALPGGRLARGGAFREVFLWNTTQPDQLVDGSHDADITTFSYPDDTWISALAPLPDGRLATGSDNGNICFRDPISGTVAHFKFHDKKITALAVIPRIAGLGPLLASGSHDGTIHLFDLANENKFAKLEIPGSKVTALEVMLDSRLASGYADGRIRLWDIASPTQPAVLVGHDEAITALAVLPDGRLASASDDATIRLWTAVPGESNSHEQITESGVTTLTLLPKNKIASGHKDGTIRIWDTVDGNQIEHFRLEDEILAIAALAGDRLVALSGNGQIHSLNSNLIVEATNPQAARPKGRPKAIFTHDQLVLGFDNGAIWLVDIATGKESVLSEGQHFAITSLIALTNNRIAVTSASGAQTHRFTADLRYDVETHFQYPDIELWSLTHWRNTEALRGNGSDITALVELADGRIAGAYKTGGISVWGKQPDEGYALHRDEEYVFQSGHSGGVRVLAEMTGNRIASAGEDNTIRIWDIWTGVEIARLEIDAAILCLAALPAGRLVVGDAIGRVHWLAIIE